MRRSADFRALARRGLTGKWGTSVLVTLVAGLLGGLGMGGGANSAVSDAVDSLSEQGGQIASEVESLFSNPLVFSVVAGSLAVGLIIGLAEFILGGAVELGHDRYYIGIVGGETPSFGTLFSRFRIFGKALGLRLFIGLFVFLWGIPAWVLYALIVFYGRWQGVLYVLFFAGFVLPIWASIRYAMATYLMAQYPEKGIRECVNDSKALMQGHKSRYFWLQLSFIGWVILSALTFGIGFLWANPYMTAANAAFYLERTGQLPPEEGGWAPQPQA